MNILILAEQYVDRNDTHGNRDDFWFSQYYAIFRERTNMDVHDSVMAALSLLHDKEYVDNFLEEARMVRNSLTSRPILTTITHTGD